MKDDGLLLLAIFRNLRFLICIITADGLFDICYIDVFFSLILDNERWKQADVPTEFQDLVDYISSSGIYYYRYQIAGFSSNLV